jgi:hypothetical protein
MDYIKLNGFAQVAGGIFNLTENAVYRADGTTAVRRSPFAVRIETQLICEKAK